MAHQKAYTESCITALDNMLSNFLWSNKKHLIAKSSLHLPTELGGLKMVSVKYVCSTAHIMFVKRLYNGIKAKWKILAEFCMGLEITQIFNEELALSFRRTAKTSYYETLLSTWFHLITTEPLSFDDLLHEELFENPLFTSDGLTFGTEYKKWKDSGILKVSDILHEKERIILDKMALEAKFNLQIKDMTYNRLIACVSKVLKQLSKVSIQQIWKFNQ